MVVGLIGLMAMVATLSFGAMWGNLRFKRKAEELVGVFQMAYNAAAESDRRYQVSLDRTHQGYVFREYTETNIHYDRFIFENALNGLYDNSLIGLKYFGDHAELETVEFDYYTESDLAEDMESVDVYHFIVGHSGWLAGGKIILWDSDGMPWTIVIHRFAKPVELFKGEVDIDLPLDAIDVPF